MNNKEKAKKTWEEQKRIVKEKLKPIKHKIFVLSNKGGVGKSSIAVNLAVALAQDKYQVGLLDADLHGPSIAKMLRIEGQTLRGSGNKIIPFPIYPNLKVVSIALLFESPDSPLIWRGPLKMKALQQFLGDVEWGELDYLIVDLPPGTGDEPLSICQFIPEADGGVVVTTPQDIALLDSRKCISFLRALKIPVLGILENMTEFICPHCGKKTELFGSGGGEKASREMKVPFLGKIPFEKRIVESTDEGRPFIAEYDQTETARVFKEIVSRIIKKIDAETPKEQKRKGK
jgi:Mrp family chromosome partitioning ATPase